MSPLVDATRFPIVESRLEGAFGVEGTRALLDSYQKLAERRQRMAFLVDLRNYDASSSDPATRKQTAAVYARAVPVLRPLVVREARIVSSAVTRYILTAFDWLTGSPWPTAAFTTSTDAELWVRRKLAEDGTRALAAS